MDGAAIWRGFGFWGSTDSIRLESLEEGSLYRALRYFFGVTFDYDALSAFLLAILPLSSTFGGDLYRVAECNVFVTLNRTAPVLVNDL